jgi:4-hydroxythreonine-4-phosphate dehydrogenase
MDFMKHRPRLLITLGDVAGIGPEVVVKAWVDLNHLCKPFVVGDAGTMERARKHTHNTLEIVPIHNIEDARPTPDRIPVLQATQQNLSEVQPGRVAAAAGQAAFDFVGAAIDLTMRQKADGIVTMPLNKEGLHAAGLKYPGHTEILAEKTGVKEFGMMLFAPGGAAFENSVGVVHVTLHMALREVFQHLSTPAVFEKINLLDAVMKKLCENERPRLAVAALNPHASDGGIFGDEESAIIAPAVEQAKKAGINVVGPLPADTLFAQAKAGKFDGVVAMYHDQGHIALKMTAGLACVNITLGLPIVRTSVAHGTAYDIAGKGKASPDSLYAAARVAALLTTPQAAV